MHSIFWNDSERRIRVFWRFLAQVALMIVLMMLAGALLAEYRNSEIGRGLVTLIGIGGSVLLAARWFDHRPPAGLGLRTGAGWWIDLAFGCLLGIFLMSAIFLIQQALGWVSVSGSFDPLAAGSVAGPMLGMLFFFLCVGITEELWMRGYVIPNIAETVRSRRFGDRAAVVFALLFAATVFGLLHVANPNASVVSTTGVIYAGIVLGLPFVWTGSLAIPIGLHFTWNAAQGLLFGFPVSGIKDFPSVLQIEQGGPAAWTGGEFGPEAGLLSVLVLTLGAGIQYLWVAWRYGSIEIVRDLAYPPGGVDELQPTENRSAGVDERI